MLGAGAALAGLMFWFIHRPAPAPSPTVPPAVAASPEGPDVVDVRYARRALTGEEARQYVGDASCAGCHPDAFRSHQASRHARTLRPVTARQDGPLFARGNLVRDAGRGLRYRTRFGQDRCTMQVTDRSGTRAAEARYAIGSGKNAVSYLAIRNPDHFIKLRTTYYRAPAKWDFTPDEIQSPNPLGVDEQGVMLNGCLLCHVTVLQRDDRGVNMAGSLLNVGCERCHGPGRRHLETIRHSGHDAEIERLREAPPARIQQLCGDCHRTPQNADLNDAHTTRNLPRFQGVAMELSACYRKSGRLSCVTCHRPHQDASPGTEQYDAVCIGCHQGSTGQPICRVNPLSGCTDCHMPRQQIEGVPFATYRNHWIKIWNEVQKPQGTAAHPPRSAGKKS